MEEKQQIQQEETTTRVLTNPAIIKIYANGFISGYSMTDLFIISTLNGMPQLQLTIPFSAAKSLKEALDNTLTQYEKITHSDIKTLQELEDLKANYKSNE